MTEIIPEKDESVELWEYLQIFLMDIKELKEPLHFVEALLRLSYKNFITSLGVQSSKRQRRSKVTSVMFLPFFILSRVLLSSPFFNR